QERMPMLSPFKACGALLGGTRLPQSASKACGALLGGTRFPSPPYGVALRAFWKCLRRSPGWGPVPLAERRFALLLRASYALMVPVLRGIGYQPSRSGFSSPVSVASVMREVERRTLVLHNQQRAYTSCFSTRSRSMIVSRCLAYFGPLLPRRW